MAYIYEEVIQIKISSMVKDGQPPCSQIADIPDLIPTLESVTSELVGRGLTVEVIEVPNSED